MPLAMARNTLCGPVARTVTRSVGPCHAQLAHGTLCGPVTVDTVVAMMRGGDEGGGEETELQTEGRRSAGRRRAFALGALMSSTFTGTGAIIVPCCSCGQSKSAKYR